ncbi:MAG TPA: FMN-binding protein, partial [Rhodocyclaceae bacterium]|nr:FMN-binding protein [Rhodocyclaceae bacterium]
EENRRRSTADPEFELIDTGVFDGDRYFDVFVEYAKAGPEDVLMRVTAHKETPGLGDYIDPKKDKNKAKPWIGQFDGKGLDQIAIAQWKVRKDGGVFDARVGATISARAITNASGRALAWIAAHRDQLFAQSAGTHFEE